jgi:hypothetical protein
MVDTVLGSVFMFMRCSLLPNVQLKDENLLFFKAPLTLHGTIDHVSQQIPESLPRLKFESS